jgi:hypothetical protein
MMALPSGDHIARQEVVGKVATETPAGVKRALWLEGRTTNQRSFAGEGSGMPLDGIGIGWMAPDGETCRIDSESSAKNSCASGDQMT